MLLKPIISYKYGHSPTYPTALKSFYQHTQHISSVSLL